MKKFQMNAVPPESWFASTDSPDTADEKKLGHAQFSV